MIKSNGAGFRARSVTHAPLAPDYTICDFQSRIKFVKKKKKKGKFEPEREFDFKSKLE